MNIFYIDTLNFCPVCEHCVNGSAQIIPPFAVPSPFKHSKDARACAVLVIPASGTFLHDYENSSNLHIGIRNSYGEVYSFDERGVRVDTGWEQCIVVEMKFEISTSNSGKYDTILERSCSSPMWDKNTYHAVDYNCYDYVLIMLAKMTHNGSLLPGLNKQKFCDHYLLPKTTKAAKYISMYRHIVRQGFLVVNTAV